MPTYRVSSRNDFDELEKRVKKFLKYEKIVDSGQVLFFAIFLGFLFFYYSISKQVFNREIQMWETLIIIGCSVAISLIIIYFASRKAYKYALEDNEWAMYYTHHILANLDRYFNAKALGPKEEYRKEALENTKKFLSCIEKRWKVGSFKLVKFVREIILDLQNNLKYRIIPALKSGDDEELEKVKSAFVLLRLVSRNFTVEGIKTVNNMIVSQIPVRKPLRMKTLRRISGFLSVHKIIKHIIALTVLALACTVTGYIAIVYGGISVEATFTTLGFAFVTFAGLYLSKQRKES